MSTIYVGMDIHKNFIQAAAIDVGGEVLSNQRIGSDGTAIASFMHGIGTREVKAAIESTCTWYHIYDALEALGIETTLVNTRRTKAIAEARIKTDKLDAVTLAQCLRTGFIAKSWVPPKDVREARNLARHRIAVGRELARCKNMMHAILLRNGVILECSDITGKAGMESVRSIPLSVTERYRMDSYIVIAETLMEQKEDAEDAVCLACNADEQAMLLTSIKGISYYGALTILSEIGDIGRFSSPKKLCSYAGLVPSTHQSGSHVYHGRIMKDCNQNLKWMLTQCTQIHVRCCKDSQITRLFFRVAKRHGRNKAVIAAANRMLRCVWYMLVKNEAFKP